MSEIFLFLFVVFGQHFVLQGKLVKSTLLLVQRRDIRRFQLIQVLFYDADVKKNAGYHIAFDNGS